MSEFQFNNIEFKVGTEIAFLNMFFEVHSFNYKKKTITVHIDSELIILPISLCDEV